MNKKQYIFTGKHYGINRVYQKGDTIELTEKQAQNLSGKVVDPSHLSVKSDNSAEIKALKAEIKALKKENKALKTEVDKLKNETL